MPFTSSYGLVPAGHWMKTFFLTTSGCFYRKEKATETWRVLQQYSTVHSPASCLRRRGRGDGGRSRNGSYVLGSQLQGSTLQLSGRARVSFRNRKAIPNAVLVAVTLPEGRFWVILGVTLDTHLKSSPSALGQVENSKSPAFNPFLFNISRAVAGLQTKS